MADETQDEARAERDHRRSEEAHWQVAEAGAEEEERLMEAAHELGEQESDWENEGGASERTPDEVTDDGPDLAASERRGSADNETPDQPD